MKRNLVLVSIIRQWGWLIPAIIGGGLTGLTLFVLPPDRVINGLAEFLFKIMPLILAVLAIALFPNKNHWTSLFLLLCFIFYMGYIDSAFFLQIKRLIDAALADAYKQQFPAFYMFNIFVNSFTVLLAIFAYRLGGASTARVLKLGLSGILIIISGLNDLTMWVMYPWVNGRPFVLNWASHVTIFIGHEPNIYEMLAFLAVHLILIGVIFWLPLEKWVEQQKSRWQVAEMPSDSVQELAGQK